MVESDMNSDVPMSDVCFVYELCVLLRYQCHDALTVIIANSWTLINRLIDFIAQKIHYFGRWTNVEFRKKTEHL